MEVWRLHPFDWERFLDLRPCLMQAFAARDLALIEDVEARRIAQELRRRYPVDTWFARMASDARNDAMAEECLSLARAFFAEIVARLCLNDESVPFYRSLPAFLRFLNRWEEGEAAARILGEAAYAESNMEPWFGGCHGLKGILRPEAVDLLKSHLRATWQHIPPPQKPSLLTRFVPVPGPDEMERDLLDSVLQMAESCSESREGMAFVVADE